MWMRVTVLGVVSAICFGELEVGQMTRNTQPHTFKKKEKMNTNSFYVYESRYEADISAMGIGLGRPCGSVCVSFNNFPKYFIYLDFSNELSMNLEL